LCLDFINTLDDRFAAQPKELLPSYADFARFAEDTGIISLAEADSLSAMAQSSPEAGRHALAAAIELRETMYEIFWARVNRKPTPDAALHALNGFLHQAAQHSSLVAAGRGFAWTFETPAKDLKSPIAAAGAT